MRQTGRGRGAAMMGLAALLLAVALPGVASAHVSEGLLRSDPVAGTSLGTSPTAVVLSFSERPEPSLSEIRVLDSEGGAQQEGSPEPVGGDPLSLVVSVPPLARGSYTVTWRVVSAVDGHATAGSFGFGVGAPPGGAVAAGPSANDDAGTSGLELLARWALIVGLVALLGAAVAGVGRFGGSAGTDLTLAAAGWLLSAVGLILLAVAQRRTAGSSLGELLDTSVGDALVWRAVAIGAAGAALLLAWRAPRIRRAALLGAAIAVLAAIVVHVDAGHAGAGPWSTAVTVAAQVAHFAAAGVWFGGLAALLLGLRGAPRAARAAAMRRFAAVAAAALIVVVATGTLRAVDELTAWGELTSSGYGRAILLKLALFAAIAGLAVRNRRRTASAPTADPGPPRRASGAELGLAVGAIAVAGVLGTLAPPAPEASRAAAAGSEPVVSVLRAPGQPTQYTVQVGTLGYIRVSPQPERPGPSRLYVTVYTVFENVAPTEELVVTAATGDAPPRPLGVRRLGPGRFVADVELEAGAVPMIVTARTRDGLPLRGEFELDVPAD
jgi:copper transport protein